MNQFITPSQLDAKAIPIAQTYREALHCDLIWISAQFTFLNQGQAIALIPARYPGPETQDDASRLASKTTWDPLDEHTYAGLGQRMLVTDHMGYALFDVRNIRMSSAEIVK